MNAMRDALFAFMRKQDGAGRPLFTLPVAYSSPEHASVQLDQLSMRSWMREHNFTGTRLEWNIDSACRDDYGSTAEGVSAWAAIHYHVCRFDDDRYRRRFSVVPGLTGLWQVSGRSMINFDDWMELDLEYVDNWSLGLDLKILLRTLPTVLKRVGAH